MEGNIVGHLLSGCFESSIIGKQEKTRPAIVTHTLCGRVAIDHSIFGLLTGDKNFIRILNPYLQIEIF